MDEDLRKNDCFHDFNLYTKIDPKMEYNKPFVAAYVFSFTNNKYLNISFTYVIPLSNIIII